MDNASKALIMAGAILIAVMLTSLGVYLFTQGQEIANTSSKGLNQQMINSHNQQFEKYFTSSTETITGTQANSLAAELRTYNAQRDLVGTYGSITPSTGGNNQAYTTVFSASQRYNVTGTYYANTSQFAGCLEHVNITVASTSTTGG